MELINALNWRYATKKFDSTKKVSSEDIEQLKEAIRLSASSYGLQLYKVLVIEDKETKEKLLPAANGQMQIIDSSHLFVFCNYTIVNNTDIDEYTNLVASTRNLSQDQVKPYGDYMKTTLDKLTDEQKSNWTAKQTYIALSNLLSAAAELSIDTTPMEGFDNEKVNEVLRLKDKGLNAAVMATVGYRSQEDTFKDLPKVRKSKETLFETI